MKLVGGGLIKLLATCKASTQPAILSLQLLGFGVTPTGTQGLLTSSSMLLGAYSAQDGTLASHMQILL